MSGMRWTEETAEAGAAAAAAKGAACAGDQALSTLFEFESSDFSARGPRSRP